MKTAIPEKKTDIKFLTEDGIAEKMARRRGKPRNFDKTDPQIFDFPLENRISNVKIINIFACGR